MASRFKDLNLARQYNIMACFECGSCAYMCPAGLPLVQHIRTGKAMIAAESEKTEIETEANPLEYTPEIHVAPSPHMFNMEMTTRGMMRDVLIALAPVVIAAVYYFPMDAVNN